jgi:hypothetical protein
MHQGRLSPDKVSKERDVHILNGTSYAPPRETNRACDECVHMRCQCDNGDTKCGRCTDLEIRCTAGGKLRPVRPTQDTGGHLMYQGTMVTSTSGRVDRARC